MNTKATSPLPLIRLRRNGNLRLNSPIFLMLLPVDDRYQPQRIFEIQYPGQVRHHSIRARILDAIIYEHFEQLSPAMLRLITGEADGERCKAIYRNHYTTKYDLNTQRFGLYFFQKLDTL